MLHILADENFDGNIVRGLLRRIPHAPIIRVQDVGLSGQADSRVLEWAAERGMVVLTHDIATFPKHAVERVRSARRMPGVFAVTCQAPIGPVIADLHLLIECSADGEWEGQILFLPLG